MLDATINTHLKCRVESFYDIAHFMIWLLHNNNEEKFICIFDFQIINSKDFPDCTWNFKTNISYEEMTNLMYNCKVNDLHVMYESLKPINEYDGKRNNIFTSYY